MRERNIKDIKVSTVMVVPNTEGSELLNKLVQKEAQLCKITGYRVKLVEGNGTPLSRAIPQPTTQTLCNRVEQCQVCVATDKASKCQVRNVVYISECLQCWDVYFSDPNRGGDDFIRHIYVGETSRSLRERAGEHVAGAKRLDEGNFISKHWQDKHHQDVDPPTFVFRVNKIHRDPLSREIHEATLIQEVKEDKFILNSKSEWNKTSLSRLTLEKSDWEKRKEFGEEDSVKAREKEASKTFKKEKLLQKKEKASFISSFVSSKVNGRSYRDPNCTIPAPSVQNYIVKQPAPCETSPPVEQTKIGLKNYESTVSGKNNRPDRVRRLLLDDMIK